MQRTIFSNNIVSCFDVFIEPKNWSLDNGRLVLILIK